MPSSQLTVMNLAFAHLAEATVDGTDDDPAPPNVVKALQLWAEVRDICETRAPWLCCLERPTINRSPTPAEDPVNGIDGDWAYPYVYLLPFETLRIWTVVGEPTAFAWERSRVIDPPHGGRPAIRATTAGPLKVAIARRTAPEMLTPLLVEALALDWAARLAGPIKGDLALAAALRKEADLAYAAARGAEATEFGGQDPTLPTDGLTAARLSSW